MPENRTSDGWVSHFYCIDDNDKEETVVGFLAQRIDILISNENDFPITVSEIEVYENRGNFQLVCLSSLHLYNRSAYYRTRMR